MFIYNAICVMSDQLISKAGTITSGEDRFMEWKTKDGNYENTQPVAVFYKGPLIGNNKGVVIRTFIVNKIDNRRTFFMEAI